MAKTFEITLGGRVRRLAFHQRDAIELKKRFGEPPHKLLFTRALGLDFAAITPGKAPRMNPALFDPEVQFAVLHRALLRGGWNVTEEKVMDLVDAAVQNGEGKVEAGDFFAPAIGCAFYSGAITGHQVDLEEHAEAAEAESSEADAAAGEPIPDADPPAGKA
jgi:hypothetical protein